MTNSSKQMRTDSGTNRIILRNYTNMYNSGAWADVNNLRTCNLDLVFFKFCFVLLYGLTLVHGMNQDENYAFIGDVAATLLVEGK